MLLRLTLFSVLFYVVYAALSFLPLEPKPEKYKDVPGCYVSELDRVIGKEMVPSDTKCQGYRCYDTNVGLETCAIVEVVPPCKIVEDASKKYPDCCPKPVCPEKA